MEARRPDPPDGPVVLFDGACGLCHRSVRFIIGRDPRGRFRFAPLQSAAGRRLLRGCGLGPDRLDTMVLVDRLGCHVRSDAALRIAGGLGGAWKLISALRIVPRPVRDALYDLVARHRHRWLDGRPPRCPWPPPDSADRFLDDGDV